MRTERLKDKIRKLIGRILSVYRLKFIFFGYAFLILFGAVLLCLPISSRSGEFTPFLDALFTATTSTCVTGLVVYDTFSHWSVFGQIIILCLIQIGGLSFMVVATLFSLLIRRTVTLKERMLIVESLSQNNIQGIVRKLKDKNIGILITDHNVQETLNITDRAYLLFEGRILFQGSPEELAANSIVREKYLGRDFELRKKDFQEIDEERRAKEAAEDVSPKISFRRTGLRLRLLGTTISQPGSILVLPFACVIMPFI